jgi:hypothetical protein
MGVAWASRQQYILAVRRVGRKNNFVPVSGNEASKLERRDGRNAKDLPDASSGASRGRSLARRGARSPIGLDESPCILVAHLRSHVYFRSFRLKHDVRQFRGRWLLSFYKRTKAGILPCNVCLNGSQQESPRLVLENHYEIVCIQYRLAVRRLVDS